MFCARSLRIGLLWAAVATPPAAADIVRVPVQRRAAGTARPGLAGKLRAGVAGAAAAQELRLRNSWDVVYSGEVKIGTPAQTLSLLFDTGSSILWVPTSKLLVSLNQQGYDGDASQTYESTDVTFNITYGTGVVSGLLCHDDISIGEAKLVNFTFAEADFAEGLPGFNDGYFDGVLGLGFPSLAPMGMPSVMQALVTSRWLDEPVFAFWLPKRHPGEFSLGGVDSSRYAGEFHFVNLTHVGHWTVALDAVKVGGMLNISATSRAIVDSGTTVLVGPTREVGALAAMIGARRIDGYYVALCNETMPSIAFRLGGVDFHLEKDDLIMSEDDGLCLLGLDTLESNLWILGSVFLRRYYVQFDWGRERVGIARSVAPTARTQPPLLL